MLSIDYGALIQITFRALAFISQRCETQATWAGMRDPGWEPHLRSCVPERIDFWCVRISTAANTDLGSIYWKCSVKAAHLQCVAPTYLWHLTRGWMSRTSVPKDQETRSLCRPEIPKSELSQSFHPRTRVWQIVWMFHLRACVAFVVILSDISMRKSVQLDTYHTFRASMG